MCFACLSIFIPFTITKKRKIQQFPSCSKYHWDIFVNMHFYIMLSCGVPRGKHSLKCECLFVDCSLITVNPSNGFLLFHWREFFSLQSRFKQDFLPPWTSLSLHCAACFLLKHTHTLPPTVSSSRGGKAGLRYRCPFGNIVQATELQ